MKSLKLLLRFATIGALVLVLLIPLSMIRNMVRERDSYREQAVTRVAQGKAGEQQFIAPLRYLPWTEVTDVEVVDDTGRRRTERREQHGHLVQTPTRLEISGTLKPSKRKVGLFRVPVYSWQPKVSASFEVLEYPAVQGRRYGTPYLAVGISDVRGLVGTPNLRVDGTPLTLESGSVGLASVSAGVHAPLPEVDTTHGALGALKQVEMDFVLDGTRALSVVPIGESNDVRIGSSWPHPRFGGRFLPNEPRVDASGFDAGWAVSALATNAQSQLLRGSDGLDALRVDLVDPVDVYTNADRASKYGLLFVLLTFVGFALFELIKRLPIHPLQYLLVGLALAIFFLLLLSLSEHIAFWKAYLVAASACIGLQFFYLSGVLRSWGRAASFAAMLAALYGALYGLLASEDNALLMGSLLLFGILATIMWVTRRLDWYEVGSQLR